MHFLDVVVALFILLEADAKPIEFLDDVAAVPGVFINRRLIADAVVGDGDLFGLRFGHRIAWDHRLVQRYQGAHYASGTHLCWCVHLLIHGLPRELLAPTVIGISWLV